MSDSSYIHFDFNTKKLGIDSYISIYPLVCMHIGSPQCDMKFLLDHVKRIKADPNARWVYMGDGGECVTKLSKGDLYGQILSPQMQMECLLDTLAPIRGKMLFAIRGNHGNRIYKESGLSFDQNFAARMGVPYMGVKAMANFVVNRSSYDCWFHHGIDSGVPLKTKISAAEHFNLFVNADAIFTAHSHIADALTPGALYEADNVAQKITTKLRHGYICGCSYDSRTGYADDKGYPPLLPAYLAVAFDGRIREGYAVKSQEHHIWRTTADYELKHDYVVKYLEAQKDNG
jgi:hypothetical protein